MAALELDDSNSEFDKQFTNMAKELLENLEKKDMAGAVTVIQELQKVRDQSLYNEIGRLTRALHESIKNFRLETANAESPEGGDSELEQASHRLSYVVDMTAKAANKTMDKVEESMPISENIAAEASEISQEWKRFLRKELKPDEFRELVKRVSNFLDQTDQGTKQLNANLSEILLAQDFQDLTGQVINRVTSLVVDVEKRLVNLVAMAGQVDQMTGIQHGEIKSDMAEKFNEERGEGPQMKAEEREDVVAGQDDVDDLLSSLGF